MVVPAAVVLSHEEQYARLGALTPAAVPAAVLGGDPCFDRMLASLPLRWRYREALGLRPDATMIAVTSTWGPNSLLGRHPRLLADLLAELEMDDHLTVAVLHPNTWFAHGPRQIRSWLGDCLRAGLRIVPPTRGWQHAIIAADVTIGDNGAVTGYSAAINKPTLLASFPDEDVAPGSAIEALGKAAPRLDLRKPLRAQVHDAIQQFDPHMFHAVSDLTSSIPGESAQALRSVFYRLMDLPEPDRPALVPRLDPNDLTPDGCIPSAAWVSAEFAADQSVHLTRWPADVTVTRRRVPHAADTHLVVHSDHPRRDLLTNAAIVVHRTEPGRSNTDLTEILRSHPVCSLAVAADGTDTWIIRHRDGGTVTVRTTVSPIVGASVIYAWLMAGKPWTSLPGSHPITIGTRRSTVQIAVHIDCPIDCH
jgi:hypothetical protein